MKELIEVIIFSLIVASASYGRESGGNSCQQYEGYIQQYNGAVSFGHYLPQPEIESEQEAYLIQACLVERSTKEVIGFKAGLTSEASKKRFGVSEAVFGVISNKSEYISNELLIENTKTILIEAELAFRLSKDIYTLNDIDKEVTELVDSVAPVIEMPLFHFKDIDALTGNNIIAANVGANKFLLGKFVSIDQVDVNSIKVSLSENGQEISSSVNGSSANQWQSLKWLIKKSYLEGYTLRKGMIYLTGSLVNPVIMKRGNYFAEYTQIDDIELMVE